MTDKERQEATRARLQELNEETQIFLKMGFTHGELILFRHPKEDRLHVVPKIMLEE